MSAIAYYLESEGLQTTGISLVRENTEALRPPRFLWTSFPLGRPLGVPGDAVFQRKVILAALDLLRRPSGPVLEDYPEDAPAAQSESTLACPVNFSRPDNDTSTWVARLQNEVQQMSPWYDLSYRRRNRTTVGIARAPIGDLANRLGGLLDSGSLENVDPRDLKYAVEDLKAYYREALTAQPGNYDFAAIERMIWDETSLGLAMLALDDLFAVDPKLQAVRPAFASRAVRNR